MECHALSVCSCTPQEGEMENLGPVDDGTESLGDVPSLSEEVAGNLLVLL